MPCLDSSVPAGTGGPAASAVGPGRSNGTPGHPHGDEFDFEDVFGPLPEGCHAVPLSRARSGEASRSGSIGTEVGPIGEQDSADGGIFISIPGKKGQSRSGPGGETYGRQGGEGSGRPVGSQRASCEEEEAQRLQDWAPAGSIPDGDVPFTITNRSHSMVGPAVTPRLSISRNSSAKVGPMPPRGETAVPGLELEQTEADGVAEALDACHVSTNSRRGAMPRISSVESFLEEAVPTNSSTLPKVGPESFELLRVVGQGAFGKVFQVQHKETGDILAMKVMRKGRILERNQGDYMQAERDILTRVVHPFVVQLHYSFQTKSKLYLLLEFVNGGHLFFQLYRQGTFSEDLARIYAAELVLAVGHLHSMGIMHRDLKPENILLDSDGHIKLTDFGLAKEYKDSDKSNSLCGTMEYMAPEIIQASGHGPAADFWSIGVLVFEMLMGTPPFSCNNRQKLQQKILKDKVKLPSFLTSEAHALLKGLLQKDPSKRLGGGPNGVADVKTHKWFKGINWDKLLSREIQPKFRPTVNGKHCTANFDEIWTKLPAQDSPASTPPSVDLAVFRNYSYIAPHLQQLPTVESDSDEDVGEGTSRETSPSLDTDNE